MPALQAFFDGDVPMHTATLADIADKLKDFAGDIAVTLKDIYGTEAKLMVQASITISSIRALLQQIASADRLKLINDGVEPLAATVGDNGIVDGDTATITLDLHGGGMGPRKGRTKQLN